MIITILKEKKNNGTSGTIPTVLDRQRLPVQPALQRVVLFVALPRVGHHGENRYENSVVKTIGDCSQTEKPLTVPDVKCSSAKYGRENRDRLIVFH